MSVGPLAYDAIKSAVKLLTQNLGNMYVRRYSKKSA